MLALTFANESDYDKVREDDRFDLTDLVDFAPGKPITLRLKHADGTTEDIVCNHTYNPAQIGWFSAGSALNLIKRQNA
jgi:aconitate hydratase